MMLGKITKSMNARPTFVMRSLHVTETQNSMQMPFQLAPSLSEALNVWP